jgi:crotonobetainyl-CoA:carnitine CoA-transferase CaiB-like acyl-CoA transferase
VMTVFVAAGVTIAPLYSIADIRHDPHFIDREIYSDIPDDDLGTIPVHKPVPTLSDTPASLRMAAPKLGQHSREILQSAGFDTNSITGFFDRNSIK